MKIGRFTITHCFFPIRNSHGYDMAKVFNSKFTYVSPVWYQIKCTANASY
jgi:hypothetical protein